MVKEDYQPGYVELHRTGELKRRSELAYARLPACDLCARDCGVDRRRETGLCRTGTRARVASASPHHGEEAPLRGWRGSGTIFFAHCNLSCQYCINYDISLLGEGRELEPEELAELMLQLAAADCHNVNLVSPSHVVPMFLAALDLAAGAGLRLPLVYNSGGYDSLTALQLLDGVVDIYMPDMKYADAAIAERYSGAADYPHHNQRAVKEMHRQVGDLAIDLQGLAQRGLLVRHLVLPAELAGTARIASFLAEEISRHTYVNVMAQYRPCYRADELPPLDRPLTREEYLAAVDTMREAGLHRLDGDG